MSIFKVEVVKINSINPHPNADRLDIASIEDMGYQVIIVKGNLNPGDLAFYFPIDSVIPENFLDEFGIRNYYSKKLRAAKLRGIFSEGLLIPVGKNFTGNVGDDYTEYFGVTKYEYPIPQGMSGEVESFIGHYKFPSPENLKRYKNILIEGEEVVVTEKLHGNNFTVLVDADGTTKIGSHNYFWKNSEFNKKLVYIRAYNENEAFQKLPPGTQIFGEIYGVQDIKYGLNNGNIGIAIFAVRRGSYFLNYSDFVTFCEEFALPRVPVLYIGAYTWGAVSQFNNANSVVSPDCIMEGVIVQPVIEKMHPEIGRVVLKLISDRYLLRKDGTELH
ncbi:RNA ligase (ATP) [Nostoc sp. 'Peltigera membranacea cyanobiont' 210A]|uniref:RNA ligase (ATP) n=1 Tax=Nostoc sp. 'Peltigera membranacea cyanobiont' 210A TaxID=2014529 RepID=UPI000B9533EC|nr:RNA ligase (ATP) [Nostoc sp. 'Peltigera membranacea cyanobiont' 210A]OYD94516.1 RNA ligase (ATP) [Nostoc sp. 'Peltigera membranacea cyanobiont' 210A]